MVMKIKELHRYMHGNKVINSCGSEVMFNFERNPVDKLIFVVMAKGGRERASHQDPFSPKLAVTQVHMVHIYYVVANVARPRTDRCRTKRA